ncbi:hypothetical protein F4859DRAFT_520195 [Xylaria cf. heliscus]|nr:hypothetical protein F4859DRAFT_520195 [Xylaria cf. heliscus]
MAEIAGLVLGALPIAIWALEKYSEPFENLHKCRMSIESFRAQIMIQNYQLKTTLANVGLRKDASREQLQECFEAKFPQISNELTFIVQQMDEVTMELLTSLNVSINAKKDSLSEKTQWNWYRVKYSLGTKKRNKILETLRNGNEDLRRVVEKSELPEEADSSKIQELKLRFSPQRCASIRKSLSSLHRALGASLCCACPSPHSAAIDLDWEAYESDKTQIYKVAVSYRKATQPPQLIDSWKKLHITPYITLETTSSANLSTPVSPPRTPSPTSLIKSKIVRFSPFPSLHPPSPSPTPSTSTSASSSVTITSSTEVNLCDAVCTESALHTLAGYFKDPDRDPDKNSHQRFVLDAHQPDPLTITAAHQLRSLISSSDVATNNTTQNPLRSLSAKQRYGIAAAIAWSVLHLGETPWLGDFWSEQQATLILENEKTRPAPTPTPTSASSKPYLSYLFPGPPLSPRRGAAVAPRPHASLDELIPNKAIFALGVVLVQLCMVDLRPGPLVEEYRAVVSRLDEVRRIAGCAYGDAAERCVKFSFPGRDMHKNFNVTQFRKRFYDDVVAPVQAAYYLMPG